MTDATKKTGDRKTRGPFSDALIDQLLSQASGTSAGAFLRQSATSPLAERVVGDCQPTSERPLFFGLVIRPPHIDPFQPVAVPDSRRSTRSDGGPPPAASSLPLVEAWFDSRAGAYRRRCVSCGGSSPQDEHYLMVAAPTLQATSSCEPVPPEQPIAPIIFPPSTSGIPPREPITPSSVMR